jgi:hypothetical protein
MFPISRLLRFSVSQMERHLSRGFYGVVERAGRRGRRPRGRVACRVGGDAAARGPGRLTGSLSGALARRGFVPQHDRCRVLTDLAVAIADGATTIGETGTLRHQGELFGRSPRIRPRGAPWPGATA